MQTRKIVIAGGNGYLGRLVSRHFLDKGDQVTVLTRQTANTDSRPSQIHWDGLTLGSWALTLEKADVLINLAGRSVNCRYTGRNRRAIYDSRLQSTAILGEAIAACVHPPKVWLQSSSATIYRHAEDREMDEATGEIGTGFSVDVCQKWEATLLAAKTPLTRKVALRSAMVMGPGSDGVFGAFHRLARLKLGGTLGHGRQFVSWVHYLDFLRALDWISEFSSLTGAVNLAAPNPLPNRDFMRVLRQGKRGLPSHRWMLEIGAFFLRTETELLLKSRRVIPVKLLQSGFVFLHPHWETAARDLLGLPLHPLLQDRFDALHAPLRLG